jgi:hypothetical protein
MDIGFGTRLLGFDDYDVGTDSYLATRYLAILGIPVFPLARYRVSKLTPGGYRFLGRGRLRNIDQMHRALVVAAVLYLVAVILSNLIVPKLIFPDSQGSVQPRVEQGNAPANPDLLGKGRAIALSTPTLSQKNPTPRPQPSGGVAPLPPAGTANLEAPGITGDGEAELSNLNREIDEGRTELDRLGREIDSTKTQRDNYKAQIDYFDAQLARYKSLLNSRVDVDEHQYDAAVENRNKYVGLYNATLREANGKVRQYESLRAEVNNKVDRYNQIAARAKR